jgi:hypothetical protein
VLDDKVIALFPVALAVLVMPADALTKQGAAMSAEAEAIAVMSDFAERTGLGSHTSPQRYLWTDAFALLNFLDLARERGEGRYRALASELIGEVHGVLGRHRPDDPRKGWLSGLRGEEGARHPTRGGLRIGKPQPERRPADPYDEALEWDRDGQYFHYLTKWMDALSRAAAMLGEDRYARHAVELAEAVFPRFLHRSPSGQPIGIVWKMSIDLSRPQVPGISPYDALDGYVTFRQVARAGGPGTAAHLQDEIAILRRLSTGLSWETADPLGIGDLLLHAFRLATLPDRTPADAALIGDVLAGADAGLQRFLRQKPLRQPASRRLGFRELGLAIGLQTLPAVAAAAEASPGLARAVAPHLASLRADADLGRRIVAFWSEPRSRSAASWLEHRDINEVMLATALLEAQLGTALPGTALAGN